MRARVNVTLGRSNLHDVVDEWDANPRFVECCISNVSCGNDDDHNDDENDENDDDDDDFNDDDDDDE